MLIPGRPTTSCQSRHNSRRAIDNSRAVDTLKTTHTAGGGFRKDYRPNGKKSKMSRSQGSFFTP
eukprot:1424133-Pleurochrysis_carterae.AAC.1